MTRAKKPFKIKSYELKGSVKNNLVEFTPEFAVDLIDLIEQNRFFAMLSKSFSISRVKSTLTLCIGDLISFHRRFSKFICGAYPAKFAGA